MRRLRGPRDAAAFLIPIDERGSRPGIFQFDFHHIRGYQPFDILENGAQAGIQVEAGGNGLAEFGDDLQDGAGE